MNKLNGNLYASDFFYNLEKEGAKNFFTKEEITNAIKKAINENIDKQEMNKLFDDQLIECAKNNYNKGRLSALKKIEKEILKEIKHREITEMVGFGYSC